MSLRPGVDVPNQTGIFVDGEGPLPVTPLDLDGETVRDLAERMPSHLAYQLRPGARVLILTPGAGLEAQLALASGAGSVTLASDIPIVLDLLGGPLRPDSSYLVDDLRVRLSTRSTRGLLAASSESYDVVIFALSDSYRPVTSGAFSLTEDYDLTVESLRAAHRALAPGGVLFLPRWLGTPPSESARAWATLLAALDQEGVANVAERVLAFRGMRTATLAAGRSEFSEGDLVLVRRFIEENGFDPVYLPGIEATELNRHNRLPRPVYHELFVDLLQKPEVPFSTYDFRLSPPTDDKPYFFHFFRWRQTPQVLATLGQQMQPFGGSGYLVLILLLGLMLMLALPLILLPLLVLRRKLSSLTNGWRTTLYFGALGAGYLLVEIPLITRLTLMLDRPALALATVLFTLMLASSLGSLVSPRLDVSKALLLLVVVLVVTATGLPRLVQLTLPLPLTARLGVAVLLVLPAGILMGIPFAAGLARLERVAPGWIPWAWSINGAISGLSGVVAALIGLDLGLTAAMLAGTASYALALASVPGPER
jgi:hypothetical protein